VPARFVSGTSETPLPGPIADPEVNTFLFRSYISTTELSLNLTRYALATQDSVGFMRAKKIQIMQRVVNDVD
jgi:hypothetical protein